MVRFLHTGDWQLGMTRHFLGEEAQARFADARFDAIRRIGRLAEDEGCAFVVVCGDVFESNQVDRRTVARALEALAQSPVPVYLLPGNHDPLDAASLYRSAHFRDRCPERVRVLEDAEPLEVAPGVELVAAPWRSKRPLRDLAAAACAGLEPRPGVTRVLAAHGAVDALSPDRNDPARIELAGLEAALAQRYIHYVALGDRHSRTRVGESGRVWYAGAPEPTDYDEVEPGQVLRVELERGKARVEPRQIGTWRFESRAPVDLTGDADLDALEQWLGTLEHKERCVLKLGLVGTLPLRGHARLEWLLDEARDLFAAIEIDERSTRLASIPDDADFSRLELSGFARRAVERLRERAGADAPDSGSARDALALLVRLAGAAP